MQTEQQPPRSPESPPASAKFMGYPGLEACVDATLRLEKIMTENNEEIWEMPDDQLRRHLWKTAFPTTPPPDRVKEAWTAGLEKLITMRNDMRLIRTQSVEPSFSPKTFARDLISKHFWPSADPESWTLNGDVEMEILPFATVISVGDRKVFDMTGTRGFFHSSFLGGKAVIIFKDKLLPEVPGQSYEYCVEHNRKVETDWRDSRKHELLHMVFSKFHNEGNDERAEVCDSLSPVNFSPVHRESTADTMLTFYLDRLKDEIISYAATGDAPTIPESFWADHWQNAGNMLRAKLNASTLTPEERREYYDYFIELHDQYWSQALEMLWISKKLYSAAKDGTYTYGPDHTTLTADRVQAMLQHTPTSQIRMLVKYAGISPKDIATAREKDATENIEQCSATIDSIELNPLKQETHFKNTEIGRLWEETLVIPAKVPDCPPAPGTLGMLLKNMEVQMEVSGFMANAQFYMYDKARRNRMSEAIVAMLKTVQWDASLLSTHHLDYLEEFLNRVEQYLAGRYFQKIQECDRDAINEMREMLKKALQLRTPYVAPTQELTDQTRVGVQDVME